MLPAKRVCNHSKSMDRLSDLPQHILQKILYFLSQHEAAQTSALSRQWRYIWDTRPNVAFSDSAFNGTKQAFISTVNNTLQRYHDRRLSLDEFHLSLSMAEDSDESSFSLLEEWVPRLAHMSVKEFCLSIVSKLSNVEYPHLPWVVFQVGCLRELYVRRCKLDRTVHDHHHEITLNHLKLLHLHEVRVEEEEILQNIISSCSSIQTMIIDHCQGLRRVRFDNLSNLKDLSFTDYEVSNKHKSCRIEIHEEPSLETITIILSMIWFHPQEFRNLKRLYLVHVGFAVPDHLSSCKFPNLESLTLRDCYGFEESHLFVDAPKIVRFLYAGSFIPSISFATTCSSLKQSTVDLTSGHRANDVSLWLIKLGKLLKPLSQSKILLRLHQLPTSLSQHFQENLFELPVEVESLLLRCRVVSFPRFLNDLFRICRPTNLSTYGYEDNEVAELLCKILIERESGDRDQLWWARDLEDARIEIYEKNRQKWDEVTVSEYLMMMKGKGEYTSRFILKWRTFNNF